jgi:hypothetical protein
MVNQILSLPNLSLRLMAARENLAKIVSPVPTTLPPTSPEPPQVSGQELADYFSGLGQDIGKYHIDVTKKYLVPPDLIDGQNFLIKIEDLAKLIAYNN